MNDLKSLNPKKQQKIPKMKHKFWLIIILIVLGLFFWLNFAKDGVFNYVFNKGSGLKAENGKVNILLLGTPGGKHDGPNLTDTIMIVSYDLSSHQAALVSLPRDLWIDEQKAKVNALYQIGLNRGNGLNFTKQEIGKILGIDIPYAIRLDFSGFEKAVDLVGGINIEVVKSFDDYVYPVAGKENEMCGYQEKEAEILDEQAKSLNITAGKYLTLLDPEGKIATVSAKEAKEIEYTDQQVATIFRCRFEHLSFKKGPLSLDGVTALKYVRSRHGNNDEGTDFARSRRQQQVLQAFRQKILSLETLTDPRRIIDLIKTFGASVETNINQSEYLDFIKIVKQMEGTKSVVVDSTGENPLLITPPASNYGGAWVLVPKDKDFSQVKQFIQGILTELQTATQSGKIQK